MVDHSIFRAFNKGALGIIDVEGPENAKIYSGKVREEVYLPEGSAAQSMGKTNAPAPVVTAANKQRKELKWVNLFMPVTVRPVTN